MGPESAGGAVSVDAVSAGAASAGAELAGRVVLDAGWGAGAPAPVATGAEEEGSSLPHAANVAPAIANTTIRPRTPRTEAVYEKGVWTFGQRPAVERNVAMSNADTGCLSTRYG